MVGDASLLQRFTGSDGLTRGSKNREATALLIQVVFTLGASAFLAMAKRMSNGGLRGTKLPTRCWGWTITAQRKWERVQEKTI